MFEVMLTRESIISYYASSSEKKVDFRKKRWILGKKGGFQKIKVNFRKKKVDFRNKRWISILPLRGGLCL